MSANIVVVVVLRTTLSACVSRKNVCFFLPRPPPLYIHTLSVQHFCHQFISVISSRRYYILIFFVTSVTDDAYFFAPSATQNFARLSRNSISDGSGLPGRGSQMGAVASVFEAIAAR